MRLKLQGEREMSVKTIAVNSINGKRLDRTCNMVYKFYVAPKKQFCHDVIK